MSTPEQLNLLDGLQSSPAPERPPAAPPVLGPFCVHDVEPSMASFLVSCEGRLSEETQRTYVKYVKHFLKWWKAQQADAPLTKDLALAYAHALEAPRPDQPKHPTIAPRRRAVMLSSVRRWAASLVAQGRLPQNPFEAVRGPEKPDKLALGYLTEAQANGFLAAFPKDRLPAFRDYLIALLMLRTGARETELCEANVGDLMPIGDQAFLQLHSKGKAKQEPVVLLPDVKAEVDRYLTWRTKVDGPLAPDDPLLIRERNRGGYRLTAKDIRRRLKPVFRTMNLDQGSKISTLSLRQTAALHALAHQEATLEDVQRMMRHESIETTRLYKKKLQRILKSGERLLSHLTATPPPTSPTASSPSTH